ncbi:MAG TPA: hypothetical protein PKV82_09875, partial [Anaerolineae bacterium]|nr:hypothetical protein [Anaerolineae bacterium]
LSGNHDNQFAELDGHNSIGTGMAQSTRVAALTNHWADEFRGMVVQSQTLFAGKTKDLGRERGKIEAKSES